MRLVTQRNKANENGIAFGIDFPVPRKEKVPQALSYEDA
jgi:hypothetical protein